MGNPPWGKKTHIKSASKSAPLVPASDLPNLGCHKRFPLPPAVIPSLTCLLPKGVATSQIGWDRRG